MNGNSKMSPSCYRVESEITLNGSRIGGNSPSSHKPCVTDEIRIIYRKPMRVIRKWEAIGL